LRPRDRTDGAVSLSLIYAYRFSCYTHVFDKERINMAKKATRAVKANGRRAPLRAWTKEHVKELKAHSRAKTPVVKISKEMKRTIGALRQKAMELGMSLGHRR
jgi:hypothetical protein